jgi:hypothetical protein
VHSLWEIRNVSVFLHGEMTGDIKPPDPNVAYAKYLNPFKRVTVRELMPQMLHVQYRTLELLHTYLVNVIYDSNYPNGNVCRQANCHEPQYAIRRFLLADELLVRAGESSRFPLSYMEFGWWVGSTRTAIEVLQSTVAEQRRPMISSFALTQAYALRILRIWLAFEFGTAPVAHFALGDVYATFFTPYPKLYMAALLAISAALYITPGFRGRLPGIRALWPVLWFWFFSYLRYRRAGALHSKGLYAGALHPRNRVQLDLTRYGYCSFWFQTSELADTTPKLVFLLTTLDALHQDGPGPTMDITAKIYRFILHHIRLDDSHPRYRLLGYTLFGALCAYGVWLHVRIWTLLQPMSVERRSNFKLTSSDFLDYQVCLTYLSPIISSLYVAYGLRKPWTGILHAIFAPLRAQSFPIDRDFVKCNQRFYMPYELPADLAVEVPLIYYFLLLIAFYHIRRAYRRVMTGLK